MSGMQCPARSGFDTGSDLPEAAEPWLDGPSG